MIKMQCMSTVNQPECGVAAAVDPPSNLQTLLWYMPTSESAREGFWDSRLVGGVTHDPNTCWQHVARVTLGVWVCGCVGVWWWRWRRWWWNRGWAVHRDEIAVMLAVKPAGDVWSGGGFGAAGVWGRRAGGGVVRGGKQCVAANWMKRPATRSRSSSQVQGGSESEYGALIIKRRNQACMSEAG